MAEIIQPPLILVFGRRGVGKTYLCADLARDWPVNHVWVFDPMKCPELSPFPHFDFDTPPPFQDTLLIFDEFSLCCSPHKWRRPWIQNIVTRGRHTNTGIIGNVQRPQALHADLQSLFTACYVGHTTRGDDLKYLAMFAGPDALQAADLPPREFIEIIA